MQVCSLPFSSIKIELSGYQLEKVKELSAEYNSFPLLSFRRLSKATYVAIILSLIFHIILMTLAFLNFNKAEQKELQLHKEQKTIAVKFINSAKTKSDTKKMEDKTQPTKNKITKDMDVQSEADVIEPSKLAKTTPKIIKQNNDINSTLETQISAQENTESELDPLIYDKNIEIYEPIPQAFNEGTIVFDPNLRKRIEEIQKEKFERSKITSFMQLQKDNEYFEFKPVGGSQMVRINGNCFIVPENDVFALSQNVWALLGNCENKIDKLNFEKPELRYRYNESY